MHLITLKYQVLSNAERSALEFTALEREHLCQRIRQLLQVLASCIILEYPLTDALTTVDDDTKDHLLAKIYQLRKNRIRADLASSSSNGDAQMEPAAEDGDCALLYAYTLVITQVEEELKKVRAEIEKLFGVLNNNSLLLE